MPLFPAKRKDKKYKRRQEARPDVHSNFNLTSMCTAFLSCCLLPHFSLLLSSACDEVLLAVSSAAYIYIYIYTIRHHNCTFFSSLFVASASDEGMLAIAAHCPRLQELDVGASR